MENDITQILDNLKVHQGYSYNELKDVLTTEEKECLFGYAWAISDLDGMETDIETDIEILDELIDGISQDTIKTVKERLILNLSEMLISFGDNHPEEED